MNNIELKNMTEAQLKDLQSQIEEQLNKHKYPARGVPCECWDDGWENSKYLRYSNGDGTFSVNSKGEGGITLKNFQPIQTGLVFSDEVITSEDITMDMDKCLCLCLDEGYMPKLRAIDGKNKYAYGMSSERDGIEWKHYRLCTTPYELMPQWCKDIIDGLDD